MKKQFILVGLLAVGFASAQDGRVGINTMTPKAALEISRHDNLPTHQSQGVMFPSFSTVERAQWTDTKEGTMIYNTTKRCLEMYFGVVSGEHQWNCIPDVGSAQSQNISVAPAGFTGSYIDGVAVTSAHTVKFKFLNNSFNALNNVDFSNAVTIDNLGGNVRVNGAAHSNVSLASGAEVTLSYPLSGTPQSGLLTANFNKLGLTATQSTTVGLGSATFSSQTQNHYVVSLIYNSTVVQGKINNTTNQLKIRIPYTNGQGSYAAFSNMQTTAAGEGNDVNQLTLSIPQGNFGASGALEGTIVVDGDGEYLVKQMAPGQEYVIATFPVDINGATTNVVVKGIGGVPDRRFDDSPNHKFIYLPIEVIGANGYKKTWLNNNLGAEYADANNPRGNFNPLQQAKAYNDHLAYGSLYQWQRPSDGHELVTWTSATAVTTSPTTSTLSNYANWTAGHSDFIIGNSSSSYSWVNNTINQDTSKHNLWQVNGANNPCPMGYHVPTNTEWAELQIALFGSNGEPHWSENALRLTWSGQRHAQGTLVRFLFETGTYWASTPVQTTRAVQLYLNKNLTSLVSQDRAHGASVRCLKD